MLSSEDSYIGVRKLTDETSHIQIKVPQYFNNPKIWFNQVDASFQLANIRNEKTKYFHLLTSLPPQLLEEYADLMDHHSTTPYSTLREAIIKDTAVSASYAASKLLQRQELGDRKPTQLLREMKRNFEIMEPGMDPNSSKILRYQFINNLPPNIQHMLIGSTASIDEIAELANQHAAIQSPSLFQIEKMNRGSDSIAIQNLQDQINAIKAKNADNDSTLCYYHRRYGKDARKCQKPCAWKSSNAAGNGKGSQ